MLLEGALIFAQKTLKSKLKRWKRSYMSFPVGLFSRRDIKKTLLMKRALPPLVELLRTKVVQHLFIFNQLLMNSKIITQLKENHK